VLLALAVLGCAARAPEVTGPPPIPAHYGPLAIDVVYPPDSALIAARDSNFIFGSVGSGAARLTIDGRAVPVEPNGAFLAWLPVPGAPGDTLATYELVAVDGDREERVWHTVRRSQAAGPPAGDSAAIQLGVVAPRGIWWVRPGERVAIRVRATAGAAVRLRTPEGEVVRLEEVTARPEDAPAASRIFGVFPVGATGTAGPALGTFEGELIARAGLGRGRSGSPVPAETDTAAVAGSCFVETDSAATAADTAVAAMANAPRVPVLGAQAAVREQAPEVCATVEVSLDGDTVRAALPLDLWILEDGAGPAIELWDGPSPSGSGHDGFAIGRPGPEATYTWLWAPGVRARATGRRNDAVRIALDSRSEAWVGLEDVRWLEGARIPARVSVGTVSLRGLEDRLEVRVALGDPVPYAVDVDGASLTLTLYAAYSDTDWLRFGPGDPFLRGARWEQPASDRYVLRLDLAAPPWGYRVRIEPGGIVLDVRKPPLIDPRHPLAGLTIVVDPGHPPAGARGPTRLYEGDANLAIAFRLKRRLEAEGARVFLTRADRSAVRLFDRTRLAELLDADVLVSVHNNALPDGVNPFESHGTSVYFFHAGSLDLARALQQGLLDALGLRDLGIGRADLALARPTWMPAALTEGAFMMIPAQEAALRDPAFLEAYARGLATGLRAFLSARAQ
jgi:N-acetylmuramoyl-L-alanine amidase